MNIFTLQCKFTEAQMSTPKLVKRFKHQKVDVKEVCRYLTELGRPKILGARYIELNCSPTSNVLHIAQAATSIK